MELRHIKESDVDQVMVIINGAKKHLKEQGIDQWQTAYPDHACIKEDAHNETGYFLVEEAEILGYLCIDFNGEKDYDHIKGEWATPEEYVVVHRLAFSEAARGRKFTDEVFPLVEALAIGKGIHHCRVDTDEGNTKMQHILKKNGFTYRGVIIFDSSEKIAFDKSF